MEHIKRTNRELAYKGSILEFYKDTMVTPDGKVAYWDHIEHKGAAAMVPVLPDGRIIRRMRKRLRYQQAGLRLAKKQRFLP